MSCSRLFIWARMDLNKDRNRCLFRCRGCPNLHLGHLKPWKNRKDLAKGNKDCIYSTGAVRTRGKNLQQCTLYGPAVLQPIL